MSKTYYHSTTVDNMINIQKDGEIHTSIEGVVYCCETVDDCLKFAAIRLYGTGHDIVAIKIDVPDDIEVEEIFDHSEAFFQCKCYGLPCPVPYDWIDTDNCAVFISPFKKEEKRI